MALGTRYSHQREVIYEALMKSHDHPTAEMLYARLKPTNPGLSLGTVYRNLKLLAEQGLITRMSFPVERYDGITESHPHFHCTQCGGVTNLEEGEYGVVMQKWSQEQQGHRVERYDVVFTGVCKSCVEAEKKKSREFIIL